jgi:hypothetical protein
VKIRLTTPEGEDLHPNTVMLEPEEAKFIAMEIKIAVGGDPVVQVDTYEYIGETPEKEVRRYTGIVKRLDLEMEVET